MKAKLMDAKVIVALIVFISLPSSAFAVEGGLGRPISGMSIAPFAGVIPPEPGFAAQSSPTSPSWVRVTSILAGAGFTTSTSASESRVTPLL